MNFYQVFTLLIFLLQNAFLLFPVKIFNLPLNLLTVPPMAVLILLATITVPFQIFINGIVGDKLLKPFNIMILFISLAYLALSLNRTGLVKFLAFKIAKSSKQNSTWILLTKFYVFSLILSVIMGNDPIILAATGLLVHFTTKARLDPIPFLFTEFSSSNIGSMLLFCGNPTNLIICEGFQIGYLHYSKNILLPFLASAVSCYFVSIFQFKDLLLMRTAVDGNDNPRVVENIQMGSMESEEAFSNIPITSDGEDPIEIMDGENDEDMDKILTDPFAAVVGSFVFVACIIVIVVSSFFNVEIWIVSLAFAAFKILFDVIWDLYRCPVVVVASEFAATPSILIPFYKTLPTLATTIASLPFDLVIFAFSQFILVEALTFHSWITIFSNLLAPLTTTLSSTVIVIGFLTILFCAILGTNITATILLTRIILEMKLAHPISSAAWLSLAFGSNIGAINITISSSLAGLLWKDILARLGVVVTRKIFWKWNWRPLAGMCLVGYTVVYLQVLLS
jgi:Na+/H+ antiporter NhaD/arsenite permease-like protein